MQKIKNVLFDIGDVLLPGRNPYVLWESLIPNEKKRSQVLSKIRFQEWGDEWDRGLAADCIANKKIHYPQEAALIQTFADQWEKTPWPPANIETIAVVRQLKSSKYKLYLASNWPADDFERAKGYMSFLDLFDGMQISGHVQYIKPEAIFFEDMMEKFKFRAEEALFIDDKEINVNAARALGMHGIVFKTASQLSSDISAFGLLPAAQ